MAPAESEDHPTMRVAVMGAARVGKSTLIQQFLYGRVPVKYSATVEELYRREYGATTRGREKLTLELLDTSGSDEFPAMRNLAMTTADAFLLVYAIDNQESFEQIRRLRADILDVRANLEKSVPPVVVVGNKADLFYNRAVGREVAETVATIDWESGYIECSALDVQNVSQVFKEVLRKTKGPDAFPAMARRRESCPAQVNVNGRHLLHHGVRKRNSCIVS